MSMDFERDKREAEPRREGEPRLPPKARVDAGRYEVDSVRMGTRRAGSDDFRGGVGLEEEARMEETVRRGTRRAIDEKEEESGGGGLYGSQIDDSHMIGAGIAELVGTFILVYGGDPVAGGGLLTRPTAGPPHRSPGVAPGL